MPHVPKPAGVMPSGALIAACANVRSMRKPSSAKQHTVSIRKATSVAAKVRPVTLTSLSGTVIYAPNFKPTRIGI